MIFQCGVHLKSGRLLMTDQEHVTFEAATEAVTRADKDLRDKKAVFHLIVNGGKILVPRDNIDYLEYSIFELEETE